MPTAKEAYERAARAESLAQRLEVLLDKTAGQLNIAVTKFDGHVDFCTGMERKRETQRVEDIERQQKQHEANQASIHALTAQMQAISATLTTAVSKSGQRVDKLLMSGMAAAIMLLFGTCGWLIANRGLPEPTEPTQFQQMMLQMLQDRTGAGIPLPPPKPVHR